MIPGTDPFLGALIRIVRNDGVYYEPGLQRWGRTWLYVNRGIGMEGGKPPVRLGCRPEIAVIEIARPRGRAESGVG